MLKSQWHIECTVDSRLELRHRSSVILAQKVVGKEFCPKSEGDSVSIPERHSSSRYSAELRFFPTSIYYRLIVPIASHKTSSAIS
jgi:hypothetical protein